MFSLSSPSACADGHASRFGALGARLLALGAGLLGCATPVTAVTLPAGFQETVAASGLQQPIAVRFAPDGQVFVAEKRGVIKHSPTLGGSQQVLVDIRTAVYNFWDRGLLSIALHPNYPATPYLYALYTYDGDIGQNNAPKYGTANTDADPCPSPPGANDQGCIASARLSRFTLQRDSSGRLTAGPEQVMIHDWCQQYPSHTIGSLVFGKDGALYVSAGDAASFTFIDYGQAGGNPCGDPPREGGTLRSQDLRTPTDPTTLNGAILRIDPETGAGLASNPLGGSADRNAARIIAHGLRNPFRFTTRPGPNQELWIGDVGWSTADEVNLVADTTDRQLRNFGWPCYEGTSPQAGYQAANLALCQSLYASPGAVTPPYFRYAHDNPVMAGDTCPNGTSSLSGVAFYGGGRYPSRFNGALFVADYSRRCIWVIPNGANGRPDPAAVESFAQDAAGPVELQSGPDGDLFYVSLETGTIRRIQYTAASNTPPTAAASANPVSGAAPLTVQFDGTRSSDPDTGDSLSYAWDLDGDGAFDDGSAARASFVYATAGQYSARLRVRDAAGATGEATVSISVGVNTAPVAKILGPSSGTTWKVGDAIRFSGLADDAQEGSLPAARLSWSLSLFHCATAGGCHEHPIESWSGTASGSFVAPDHAYPSYLQLTLTATDAGGLSGRSTLRLDPRTTQLTFQSQPGGLVLVLGGDRIASGTTRTVIVGSRNSVSAVTPQAKTRSSYVFETWSDGGAQTHDIIAPETATSYKARFRKQR